MKHLLSSITLLLLSTLAFGQVPNTFSSGETISSSKINANFSFLANAMGSGNVTAMMVCHGSGIADKNNSQLTYLQEISNPIIAFHNCISTDNTSFSSSVVTCDAEGSLGYTPIKCSGEGTKNLVIFSNELIQNKWLLNSSERLGNSNTKVRYFFYKVSSD